MPAELPNQPLTRRDQKMIAGPPGLSQETLRTYGRDKDPQGPRLHRVRPLKSESPAQTWFG